MSERFTSTCVETAITSRQIATFDTVHLHVRGDSWYPKNSDVTPFGSPPRAWRQLSIPRSRIVLLRFTSTCVETAPFLVVRFHVFAVHLHVRGDSDGKDDVYVATLGSPPRAWRQPLGLIEWLRGLRFTSTCVETARPFRPRCVRASVHLHVRGDSASRKSPSCLVGGSPPRAWRQRKEAGRGSLRPAVHLHVRGDSDPLKTSDLTAIGSPPRAWRQQEALEAAKAFQRFTSTCVETAA